MTADILATLLETCDSERLVDRRDEGSPTLPSPLGGRTARSGQRHQQRPETELALLGAPGQIAVLVPD